MHAIIHTLNLPWVEALLTVISIMLAIFFGIYALLKRSNPKLVYQARLQLLIGGPKASLSEFVQVLYKDTPVPRLTSTLLFIWNDGQAPIRRNDISARDPLRFELEGDGAILDVSIVKVSRSANQFGAHVVANSPSVIECEFDFLDREDGAVVQILHTAQASRLKPSGTIIGTPEGIKDIGVALNQPDISRFRREALTLVLLTLCVYYMAYLGFTLASLAPRHYSSYAKLIEYISVSAVVVVTVLTGLLGRLIRLISSHWPKTLNIDD